MPSADSASRSAWPEHTPKAASSALLLTLVLVTATTGLVYELTMAAVASYLLGDSVTQFSLVIGVYLSALGSALTSRATSNGGYHVRSWTWNSVRR